MGEAEAEEGYLPLIPIRAGKIDADSIMVSTGNTG
jgi:hypothetical protein